jgi:Flp pilus assembly pilin Flp
MEGQGWQVDGQGEQEAYMFTRLMKFVRNERGDMAEKAVVMFLIILVAIGAFQLLGAKIAEVVRAVASAI